MTRALLFFQHNASWHDAGFVLALIGLWAVAIAVERLWDHFDNVFPED